MAESIDILAEYADSLEAARSPFSVRKIGNDLWSLRTKEARVDRDQIDRGKMLAPCTITTQAADRSLDIVVTSGIDLSGHQTNPVVLCNHGLAESLPIGKAEGPDGYTVARQEGKLRSVTHFSQKSLLAEQVFALVEEGILKGCSVGIRIKMGGANYRTDHPPEYKGWPGLLISSCELIEYSHVTVPDNPQALADRIGKGILAGKPIETSLWKSLSPHLPALREMVVGGFDLEQKEGSKVSENKEATIQTPAPAPASAVPVVALEAIVQDDSLKDWPTGAVTLRNAYDRLMDYSDHLESQFKKQDSREVKNLLTGLTGAIDQWAAAIGDIFKAEYPDLEPFALDSSDLSTEVSPLKRLSLRLEALRKEREKAKSLERLPGRVRGTLEKAGELLTTIAASGAADATQKSLAELLGKALAGLTRELGADDAAELEKLKSENQALKEERKELSRHLEQIRREFHKARMGR